jgi:glycosyltransferase involved in cell wall biosynthesis
MKRVLYTGAFRFPEGDAAALRVSTVGALFESVGCTVSFAGWEAHRPEGAHYHYQGHDCYSQAEFREQPRGPVARLAGFLLRGINTLRWLAPRHAQFDVVVAYNPPALFALALLAWGGLRHVRVVLDSTEWYESEHLPGGRWGLAALENWVRMRLVYPRFTHVICISRFLERHYRARHNTMCNVVNVPPLSHFRPPVLARPALEDGVFFVYAGEAGKKDQLLAFIQALPALQRVLQRPVLLRIAGLDTQALRHALRAAGLEAAAFLPYVECWGRLSRQAVQQLYSVSHFSVLFRENKRYAWAGFPTKAVESWCSGCPIITNRVGDVGELATHLVNALVVSEDELTTRLPEALQAVLQGQQHAAMSAHSVETAARHFSAQSLQPAFAPFANRLGLIP